MISIIFNYPFFLKNPLYIQNSITACQFHEILFSLRNRVKTDCKRLRYFLIFFDKSTLQTFALTKKNHRNLCKHFFIFFLWTIK